MKTLECYYVLMLLVPFGYSLELVNLDKLEAENDAPFNLDLEAKIDTLKTREERSPHSSSDFYPGFFNIFEGAQQGSHEQLQGSHEQEQDCPFPYIRVGENCYYATCSNTGAQNWNAARSYCQTSIPGGGDLAVFDSANDYADAVRYIRSLDPNGAFTCDYWIGGYANYTTIDNWVWINGDLMPRGVPFWDMYGSGNILPISSSSAGQYIYLLEAHNYFFNQAFSGATYLPLCQISLEKGYKGHTDYGSQGGSSHEGNYFDSQYRSDQQGAFYPQMSQVNPFQNSPLRSSQFPSNSHFTRSFGPQIHRVPYVMNSQRRNLPVPGMFNERKATANSNQLRSMIDSDNMAKPTAPEIKDSDSEKKFKIIDSEINGKETKMLGQIDNHKSIDDQQDKDDLMKESETLVPSNIEIDVPAIPLNGDSADINLPIHELKAESTESEAAAINNNGNKEHENQFINQEDDGIDIPFKEVEGKVSEKEHTDDIAVFEVKNDLSGQEVFDNNNPAYKDDELIKQVDNINNPVYEHKDVLIEQESDISNPVIKNKDELIEQESDISNPVIKNKEELIEQGSDISNPVIKNKDELIEQESDISNPVIKNKDELIEQESDITNPVIKNKDELIKRKADINNPVNKYKAEFPKQNSKIETLADIYTTKDNANFNQETNLEVETEQDNSEGKQSEFESEDLNSYLPGMIYDIVNILQNIDRTYKPRFNIDRTAVI